MIILGNWILERWGKDGVFILRGMNERLVDLILLVVDAWGGASHVVSDA